MNITSTLSSPPLWRFSPDSPAVFRRNLALGALASILIHASIVYFGSVRARLAAPASQAPTIELEAISMPPLKPDEVDTIEDTDPQPSPLVMAPPIQTDVPRIAPPGGFTMKPEQPPIDVSRVSRGVIVIPQGQGTAHGSLKDVFDLSKLDQRPEPIVQGKPQYPYDMRRAKISGTVTVDFIVDSAGNVRNAYAISSNQREFEAPAVQAVSKWRFRPGKKDGHNVNTHMQVPILFFLDNKE